MSKAVIAGRLQHISPSQIDNFSKCKRKWYLEKVRGIEQPRKEHFEKGEMLHLQMENWYNHGIRPQNLSAQLLIDSGEIPARRPEIIIEEPRDYRLDISLAEVPVKGRIDLLDPFPKPGEVHIYDWKSSSDISKWAKTPDQLVRNPQLIIYAQYVFKAFFGALRVLLAHGYLQTKAGFAAKTVKTDLLAPEDVNDTFTNIESRVEEIKATAAIKDWRDVEKNERHCEEYGGCPYQQVCGTGKYKNGLIFTEDDNMTPEEHQAFILKLKSQKRTGVNPPDAAPPSKEKHIAKKPTTELLKVVYKEEEGETFLLIPNKTPEEATEMVRIILGRPPEILRIEVVKDDNS